MAGIEEVIAKGDKHRSVANTVMNTNRCTALSVQLFGMEGCSPHTYRVY